MGFPLRRKKGFQPSPFILVHFEQVGRLSFVQMRDKALEQGGVGCGVLVVATGFLEVFLEADWRPIRRQPAPIRS